MTGYDLGQVVGEDGRGIERIEIEDSVMIIYYTDNTTDEIEVEETDLENYLQKTDVKNNLESTAINLPLSALQGKLLKEDIDGKSKVAFNRALNSGVEIGTITIDDVPTKLYCVPQSSGPSGSSVSFQNELLTGTLIGRLTIDGNEYSIYAPSGGSTITVDNSLTPDSSHPVKSSAIHSYLTNHYVANEDLDDYPSKDFVSSNYAAKNHSHGQINKDGQIGNTSGLPLITGSSGAVTTGAFGTSSGTFSEGNHGHTFGWVAHPDNQAKVKELYTNEAIGLCILYVNKTLNSVSETDPTNVMNVTLPHPPSFDIYSNSTHTTHNMRLTKDGVVQVMPGVGEGGVAVATQFLWHYEI